MRLRALAWGLAVSLSSSGLSLVSGCVGESGGQDEAAGDDTSAGEEGEDAQAESDSEGEGEGEETGEAETGGESGDTDGSESGELECPGPYEIAPTPVDANQPATPTQPGSTWAYFELEDFQPQSCNFGEVYGLETFKGQVTVVVLVRATCEICQGTMVKLEQMRAQLSLEGHDVWFVAINQAGYEAAQQELIDRASFPLLQDTAEVDAWDLMNEPGLGTDDVYIYDAEGILDSYFNYADANPSIDLNTESGWDTVYEAILAAF
ncbi:redoxin domain-containing protein [Pseudenhygromyxa sp. WMMC2535]|uniref:peroxiredoxin family protein n=1 Tax=Pseudenhygromyxa sp. WMMC2535 TaxID=2712867 RepID=UPI0015544E2B|nr:redoxin domain-containing protein [Pseudenhygromyxa sp. WMMC2535]NVB42299.1 redoxin domain-containing protein [Pseudenhygromyxa sp. WMMC2535]